VTVVPAPKVVAATSGGAVIRTSVIRAPSTGDGGLAATNNRSTGNSALEAAAIGLAASMLALGSLALARRTRRS
jgi:hypothetical protein